MAFEQAKWQEKSNNVTARRSKIMRRFNPSFNRERPVGNYVKKKITSPTDGTT